MQVTSWAELLREFDSALAFVRNLGLGDRLTDSRLMTYRQRIAELTTVEEREGDAATFAAFTADSELNSTALTEAQEFVTVVPYLRSIDPVRAERKLKLVLQGPQLPQDENGNSNEPRNTMFELNVAARLQRAGLLLDPRADEDVRFMNDGVVWVGECKRPYDIGTIRQNLSRACEQLNQRLAAERLVARGLIAISLSRPLAARMPLLEYGHSEELRAILKERVGEMVCLMAAELRDLRAHRPGQVAFLIAHLIMPAWDHSARIPTTVQYSAGTDTSDDGSRDGESLWGTIRERSIEDEFRRRRLTVDPNSCATPRHGPLSSRVLLTIDSTLVICRAGR